MTDVITFDVDETVSSENNFDGLHDAYKEVLKVIYQCMARGEDYARIRHEIATSRPGYSGDHYLYLYTFLENLIARIQDVDLSQQYMSENIPFVKWSYRDNVFTGILPDCTEMTFDIELSDHYPADGTKGYARLFKENSCWNVSFVLTPRLKLVH